MSDEPDLVDPLDALAEALAPLAHQALPVPLAGTTSGQMTKVVQAARRVVEARERMATVLPPGDLPYEEVPDGPLPAEGVALDLSVVSDHLAVRALSIAELPGIAAVAFTFSTTAPEAGQPTRGPGHPPRTLVAPVLIGTPPVLRSCGTILRDTLNAAAARAR